MRRRARAGAGHDLLPRTSATAPPRTRLLRGGRPLARWLVQRRFSVALHCIERVPPSGGVVLAANHVGIADGPILAVFGPRPVHALTKQEIFVGPLGTLLRASGQLPVDRFHVDTAAVRACLRVLRDGGAVGVFPEGRRGAGDLGRFHRGAAYLALVAGAPVVPVVLLGTREPGAGANALPPRGGSVDVVYGEAVRLAQDPQPWPRTREQVARASLLLRERMLATLDEARMLTGRDLPGPLAPGELEDDPHTGVVEQGAP